MSLFHRFMPILRPNRIMRKALNLIHHVGPQPQPFAGSYPVERKMQITRAGSQPSGKGPADYFTGSVRIDTPFKGSAPARVGGAIVTFEPGARTAWHTHPLGQTLIVTSGCGWAQREGGQLEEIRPGRRRLVLSRREALAWRNADYGDDARCYRRGARRQSRRLDGEGQRRTIPRLIVARAFTQEEFKNAEAQTWKERPRSLGHRPGLHGTELWLWSGDATSRTRSS